jgi:hypothetical protein
MMRVKLYIFLVNGSVCRQMGFYIKVKTKLTGAGAWRQRSNCTFLKKLEPFPWEWPKI